MTRVSRRSVLALAGALALRARGADAPAVPDSFDHMLLGCPDLDKGIEFDSPGVGDAQTAGLNITAMKAGDVVAGEAGDRGFVSKRPVMVRMIGGIR